MAGLGEVCRANASAAGWLQKLGIDMQEHPKKPDLPRPSGAPDIVDLPPADLNPAPPPDIPPEPVPDRPEPQRDVPGLT